MCEGMAKGKRILRGKSEPTSEEPSATSVLRIGMKNWSKIEKIRYSIEKLPGPPEVVVDHLHYQITVRYDPQVLSMARLRETVELGNF
jgi:hypothetical protein